MKSFKSFISEEVLPTANVENGNFDIENDAVRGQINVTLASVTAQAAVTPYVLLRKVSKALAYFHIILPKRTFLEGSKGIEVYEVMQYGDKMGMNNDGEFINHVPPKFFLFFQYSVAHPFNVTYTKPNIDGMFRGIAKIVDQAELTTLLNAAEAMMAESCAYDDKATESQRHAGRDDLQKIDDKGSPSTKKAVDTSEKGGKINQVNEEDQIDEISKGLAGRAAQGFSDRKAHAYHVAGQAYASNMRKLTRKGLDVSDAAHHKARKAQSGMDLAMNKLTGKAKVPANEETLDEVSPGTLGSYIKKAHVSGTGAAARGEIAMHRGQRSRLLRANKTGEKREQGINLAIDKMAGRARVHAKEETLDEISHKLATKYYHKASDDLESRSKKKSHSDDEKKKNFNKIVNRSTGIQRAMKRGIEHLPEETLDEGMTPVKKSYGMRKMKTKVSTKVKRGLGVEKGASKTILVTKKGDPHAASGGGVHRIPKDKYDPTKHNLAVE